MERFTLSDVASTSNRIYDPSFGWRNRLPEERITLSYEQKESFVRMLGYRCSQKTKRELEIYISNPHAYQKIPSWFEERIFWVGNECRYCAGQDRMNEFKLIRKAITQ